MTPDECKQLIVGPMTAFPTAYDRAGRVDPAATADLAAWCVERGMLAGRTILKATSGGEGTDLDDQEWPLAVRAVVKGAAGKVPVACGLNPKDTRHVIQDARRAKDEGAFAVQLDTPFFYFPSQDDMVRFFTDVSDAVDIGIIIMNTYWFGGTSLQPATLGRLADAEHVLAFKWAVPAGEDYDCMRQYANRFAFIDNSGDPIRCMKNGGAGYVDSTITYHPAHALHVWELIQAGQYDAAQAQLDQVNKQFGRLAGRLGARSGGNRVGRVAYAVMGHPIGDPRPPVEPLDAGETAELRALFAGFGWPVA